MDLMDSTDELNAIAAELRGAGAVIGALIAADNQPSPETADRVRMFLDSALESIAARIERVAGECRQGVGEQLVA